MAVQRRPQWVLIATVVACAAVLPAAPAAAQDPVPTPRLLVRLDDVGMCHSTNAAVRRIIASGTPISASVMTACPWFDEAAAILRDHPDVAVGIHLTLNSEWTHYRWGPVLGRSAAPSLVDDDGYLLPSEEAFAARAVALPEVKAELEAQVQRALDKGLHVDYLDGHMLTAFPSPQLVPILQGLATRHRPGLSRYFGERSGSLWDVPPERKLAALLAFIEGAGPGVNLLVVHPGLDTLEMTALVDANYLADPFRVGRHRQAEVDALTSPAFRRAVAAAGLAAITYRDLVDDAGLGSMTRPAEMTSYSESLVPTP